MNRQIEIFRAGHHIDSAGVEGEFTEEDLRKTAEAYDPSLHEAPIVVGHPAHNMPAYGWVKGLSVEKGRLNADVGELDQAFQEAVRNGRYKKISASFYTPNAKTNPKPGVYYLRHVGFLGASPPAVKGLRPVAFSDGEEKVLYVEMTLQATLWRRIREWLLEKFGKETADDVIPDWMIEALSEEEGGESNNGEVLPATGSAEASEIPSELLVLRREIEALRAEYRSMDAAAFLDGLIKEGRVLPSEKAGWVEILSALGETSRTFNEAGRSVDVESWLKDFLSRQPVRVHFGEMDAGTAVVDRGNAAALACKARDLIKERGVSAAEAVASVLRSS